MNINLQVADGGYAEDGETLQEMIDEHQEILKSTGLCTIGPAVLVPEGPNYPGSYQVWNPVSTEEFDEPVWAYVNTEGVIVYAEYLPEAQEMKTP